MSVRLKNKKRYRLEGEVSKLSHIIEILKSMTMEEQQRTLDYLTRRKLDQITIADIEVLR